MDKKKIISSLALAGILSASVLGANVKATAGDYLKPVGVYKQLVEGRTVVPYVLEDSNSSVTVKDLKGEFTNLELVNGMTVTDESYVLGTGDTFKADGVDYTVIVYADVNGDGVVDTFDAVTAQSMYFENNADAIQNEAADVVNDGTVDTFDANRIQGFYLGRNSAIDQTPEAETPEEEESIYTVSINDNGYINNQNVNSTVAKIKSSETFDESKRLSIVLRDEEGTESIKTTSLEAHKDYREITLNSSVANLKDGKIEGELKEGDKIVARFTTEKNTTTPASANVRTDRTGTKTATLSLEACGDSDITKIYYKASETEIDDKADLTNTMEVSENKVSNAAIADNLETNKSYKVYYVLENAYGSQSEILNAVITSDAASVTTPEPVKEVIAPDLSKATAAEFTWVGTDGTDYVATLYKDGKAIAVATNGDGITNTDTAFTATFTDKMTEEGTYKVEVYQEATENSEASAPTASSEVKVEKVAAVTDLQFRNEDGKVMLSWTNSNAEGSFKDYTIKLFTIVDGKEVADDTIASPADNKTEVEVTSSIEPNTIYIAKVVVNANENQMAKINSDEVVSSQFYKVGTPSVAYAETSENEVVLNATGVEIEGETTTYKVEIYDVDETNDPLVPDLTYKATKAVEINKDGQIVIDGLESNSPYSFKLIAVVNGEEVESDYSATVRTLPELKNLTVVATEEEAKEAGKVYSASENKVVVGEASYELANYNNSSKLANSLKVINTLKAGDVVTIEDETITLKLDGGASASVAIRDFSKLTGLKEAIFDITSNGYNKTIKTPDAGVKEVILRGSNSIFDLTDVNAEKITLTDGVEVSNAKKVTVAANSTVIINGAKVTTVEETEIDASTPNQLDVTVNEKANDLVFENVMEEAETLTINFVGSDDFTAAQAGTIEIKSKGGKITVSSTNANVNAELNIEVNSGDVDITSAAFTGDKNVTVSVDKDDTSTINAVAKTKAPTTLTGVSVDLTDEELLEQDNVTEDNLDEVKDFLASFGLNGTGAKITATEDSDKVTIEFSATEDNTIENVEIGNLK